MPLGKLPMELDDDLTIVARKNVLTLRFEQGLFLRAGQPVSISVSHESQHFPGLRNVLPVNQNVEVDKLPKREVAVGRNGQDGAFVGYRGYLARPEGV